MCHSTVIFVRSDIYLQAPRESDDRTPRIEVSSTTADKTQYDVGYTHDDIVLTGDDISLKPDQNYNLQPLSQIGSYTSAL
jgi:hypothetical protein